MNSGLYSLIVRNTETNQIVFLPIKDEKQNEEKYKVNVSIIDEITTCFIDEQHLIERLNENGYINFKNADIFITYKNNGKNKIIEPAYKNYNRYRYMVKENEVKLDVTNEYFIDLCDTIFTKLHDNNLRNYIVNNWNINLHLKQKINGMFSSKELKDINDFKSEIIADLSDYKTLRNMVTEIMEYCNPKLKEERLSKEENRIRALSGLPTKEEEEFLARTMNINIPTDFNMELTKKFEDALRYQESGEEIREMIDLDDLQGLSYDQALALNYNLREMDEYVEKARK